MGKLYKVAYIHAFAKHDYKCGWVVAFFFQNSCKNLFDIKNSNSNFLANFYYKKGTMQKFSIMKIANHIFQIKN